MKHSISFIFSLLLAAFTLVYPHFAQAVDTTEPFDVGATDVEFYLGAEGLGKGDYEKTLFSEMVLGYGLMDNFSAYFGVSAQSNEALGDGSGSLGFGIYGTPLDTDHVDLDLFLDNSIASGEFALTPSLELNVDLRPERSLWGIYLRLGEVLTGRDTSVEDDPETLRIDESETRFELAPVTEMTWGTYWTITEAHQLLLEYDMAFAHNHDDGEQTVEIGGLALGYNVTLGDAVEMINQVNVDLPQSGEKLSAGISTGIIVTLPSIASAP